MTKLLSDPVALPLFVDTPLYTERVTLNGREFLLRFDFTAKEDRWYLSIFDAAGVAVRRGIKIIPQWDMLRLCADERQPRGVVFFADLRGSGSAAPAFADLGRRVALFYFPEV